MIHAALLACIALGVNCAYAVCAITAASRYGIALRFTGGAGLAVLAAGTAVEVAAINTHDGFTQIALLIAFGAVITGAACDAACGYVFDVITMPCLALLLLLSIASHTFTVFAFGVLACGGALMILYALTRGRGLGLGDVKLACCIGAAAGAAGGVEALGIAFVLGGAYAAFLLGTGRARRGGELRFAPYLAAGTALIALHGAFV